MARHEGRFDPRVGVGFAVIVFPQGRYTLETLTCILGDGRPPTPPVGMYCTGRLDTGTTITLIAPQIVRALHLSPIGEPRDIIVATGVGSAYPYRVALVLPFDDDMRLVPDIEVLGLPKDWRGNFTVLLGLDILRLGTFTMSGDGRFTFEIP